MYKINVKKVVGDARKMLNRQTNLEPELVYLEHNTPKDISKDVVGQITLLPSNIVINFEYKKWINAANLPTLIDKMKGSLADVQTLLITEYVNPMLAQRLKNHDVQFLDTAGNAYINHAPVYIDIQGKKPMKPNIDVLMRKQIGKAFQPKGMKVIFMFLIHPELLNKPMRAIASQAEVALGTVKQVIDDLEYQGFVVNKGNNERAFTDTHRLFDKWLGAYPENMQAKLNQNLYTTDNPELLKTIDVNDFEGCWGGELAAQRYDDYLTAKDFLIYIAPAHQRAFLNAARLRKPANNEIPEIKVMLVEPPFESRKIQEKQTGMAHPLLVYANLITSVEPRNMDAAKRLYGKYLA